jgi:small subunit ribosomal protein S6
VRRYETIFILRPDIGETQIKQSLKRVSDIVSNGGGELVETDEWGIRELAYRIKRERRGYYVRLDYVAPGAVMNEVERNLKLMDESLRHLSVMVEDDADPVKLRGEIEARQRRLAEARAAAAAPSPAATAAPPPTAAAAPPSAAEATHSAGEAAPAPREAQGTEESPKAEQTPGEPAGEASAAEKPAGHTEAGNGADQN